MEIYQLEKYKTLYSIIKKIVFYTLILGIIATCKPENSNILQSTNTFENSIGMEFIEIPAGEFLMGCSEGDNECSEDEKPQHKVKISKSFYLGKYEVTQGQWSRVMGENRSEFKDCGDDCPLEHVSWNYVQNFIEKLCKLEKQNPCKYRLPTEAEWEYAARAGSKEKYYWGERISEKYLWYDNNSEKNTHQVGKKIPNAWGLYDMSGNVFEWVQDRYKDDYYKNSPAIDPKGINSGEFRVLRGCSWSTDARVCRISSRFGMISLNNNINYGFRLLYQLSLENKKVQGDEINLKPEENLYKAPFNQSLAEELYHMMCASCHGDSGEGNGEAADSLDLKPTNFKSPNSQWKNGKTISGITKTLNEGIPPGMHKYSFMRKEEISTLAKYVLKLGNQK